MHAIGAHNRIGAGGAAVLEAQRHPPAGLIEPDQLLVEMDDLGRHDGCEGIVQVGAMHA